MKSFMRLKFASTIAAVVGLLSYGVAQETSQPAPSAASDTGAQTQTGSGSAMLKILIERLMPLKV